MKIDEIYITNRNPAGDSITCSPCGACRQVIAEFSDSDTRIHYQGPDGVTSGTIAELLPDSFRF